MSKVQEEPAACSMLITIVVLVAKKYSHYNVKTELLLVSLAKEAAVGNSSPSKTCSGAYALIPGSCLHMDDSLLDEGPQL